MNIVCIAWGSLLWKPGPLKLASGWHPGGPRLSLEFARVSDDSPEVALVLCEGARLQATYWAYIDTGDLVAARAMVGAREKITPARPDWIGSIPVRDVRCTPDHIDTAYRRQIEAALGWRASREAHVTRIR